MTEAVCIILDIGATASQKPEGGKSFLEISQELASLFVERRLFSESKDEICLVLLGSEGTSNSLDYDHVSVLERGFGQADWDLVTFLREHVQVQYSTVQYSTENTSRALRWRPTGWTRSSCVWTC